MFDAAITGIILGLILAGVFGVILIAAAIKRSKG